MTTEESPMHHPKHLPHAELAFTLALAMPALFGSGCAAHAPPARLYRYAELVRAPESARHIFEQPTILEFLPGDRLPIELAFRAESFALEPAAPPLALIAKEHCYVRIDGRGLRVSSDLAHFDWKPVAPGSFFIGFTAHADGPRLIVKVATPRRR